MKGVTRWAKGSGNATCTVGGIGPYDFMDRFSSIDNELGLHRRHMEYVPDSVFFPAAYADMLMTKKHSLNVKMASGKVYSAGQMLLWIHMPGQTVYGQYGTGHRLKHSGAFCKISEALNADSKNQSFDMVNFTSALNTAYVLNGDNAVVVVSDMIIAEDGTKELVIEDIKKVKEKDSPAVHAHIMAWYNAIWNESKEPVLEPAELVEEEKARRSKSAFVVPESPVVRKKARHA